MATRTSPIRNEGSENEERIEDVNHPLDLDNHDNDPLINNPPEVEPEPIETVTLPRTTLDALKNQVDSLHEKLMSLTSSQTQSDAIMA